MGDRYWEYALYIKDGKVYCEEVDTNYRTGLCIIESCPVFENGVYRWSVDKQKELALKLVNNGVPYGRIVDPEHIDESDGDNDET